MRTPFGYPVRQANDDAGNRPGAACRETAMTAGLSEIAQHWETYRYFAIHRNRFVGDECAAIIDLYRNNQLVRGKISTAEGRTVRDSDIFWIPRAEDTDWIFSRLQDTVSQYNAAYGF